METVQVQAQEYKKQNDEWAGLAEEKEAELAEAER